MKLFSSKKKFLTVWGESFFEHPKKIPFHVYLRLEEHHYVHVFSKETGIDYIRLVRYLKEGVKRFFILEEDKEAFLKWQKLSLLKILKQKNIPLEKKAAFLLNVTEENLAHIFVQYELDHQTAQSTQKMIAAYLDLLKKHPDLISVLAEWMVQEKSMYTHALVVTIFTMLFSKALGVFHRDTMHSLGLGAFLHDIGWFQLPKSLSENQIAYTQKEKAQLYRHPVLGAKMISESGLSEQVAQMILQHHERFLGGGYPECKKGKDIFLLARVVGFLDRFCHQMATEKAPSPQRAAQSVIRRLSQTLPPCEQKWLHLFQGVLRVHSVFCETDHLSRS